MLAVMLGYGALEQAIDNPMGNARYGLAAAAGLGLFCHFAIGPALVLFGVIALLEIWRRNHDVKYAIATTFHIFWPAALAALPVIASVIAGYFVMGGFTIGGIKDYTLPAAIAGMAKMVLLVLGLPESALAVAFAVIGVPLAILGALFSRLVSKDRRIAYAIILIALPLAVFAAHPPNTNIPRYYFVSAVFLVLLIAECFGSLWRFGGWRRAGAVVALGVMLAGGAVQTRAFQEGKSPAWPEALDVIAASGQMATGGLYDRNVHEHVAFYNRTHAAQLEFVPPEQVCARAPQWFIAGINDIAREPPPRSLDVSGEGCALHYDMTGVYGAPGLSQTPWALYRQADAAPAR
jgi:hypothetical protein